MTIESIAVRANGMEFVGWTSVTVVGAMNLAAMQFELQVTEVAKGGFPNYPPWHFPPNTLIEIVSNGSLLIDGVVEEYNPQMDEQSHIVIIKGSGRGIDFVQSSPFHPTGQFENQTVFGIVQALAAPFGSAIRLSESAADLAGEIIPRFNIARGSTAWAEAMRLISQRGATLMGAPDGAIVMTRANPAHHAGGLVQGFNIKAMQAKLTARDKFSNYFVVGQGLDESEESYEVEGQSTDDTVPRFRLKEIIDTANTDAAHAQLRADWERARASGMAAQADIVTPGFRDSAAALWIPGNYVFVQAPALKIEQDMVIEQVVFQQTMEGGTFSTLTVVAPEAYGGEGGPSGSGDEWRFRKKNPKKIM